MISRDSRPRLAAKARLRFDRQTDRTLVLFPEKGLELSATAADVVHLCTGEHTVSAIVERLLEKYTARDRDSVESEVLAFLNAMADRCLIEDAA
ncbi:MAG: pyrroloquinoline quinone biosynthesis peptide chaperone PqqD [Candidatus Binatia bacterium]